MGNNSNKKVSPNIIVAVFVALIAFVVYVWQSIFSPQEKKDQADQYEDQK